jgi:hypothetical protein
VHKGIAAERKFLKALLSIDDSTDTGAHIPGAICVPAHSEDEWLGELTKT